MKKTSKSHHVGKWRRMGKVICFFFVTNKCSCCGVSYVNSIHGLGWSWVLDRFASILASSLTTPLKSRKCWDAIVASHTKHECIACGTLRRVLLLLGRRLMGERRFGMLLEAHGCCRWIAVEGSAGTVLSLVWHLMKVKSHHKSTVRGKYFVAQQASFWWV